MPTATICACTSCECEVATGDAIEKEGELFCSNQCAEGHAGEEGCGHEGCECHEEEADE